MLRSLLRFLALSTAIAAIGCGRQHDLGAGGSSPTSTSTGGAGGATSSSSAGSTGGAGGATSSSSSSSTGGIDAGPPGPTELTIVNGINDYPAIRLCFLPGNTPWPAAATGLAFAGSQVVSPLAAAIPTGGDVTPWVIAGDLAQTSGKTCTEILALASGGAPAVLAQPLAVIPKSVWASNKSLLMVPNGCLGGPGHDDPSAKLACGSSYSAATPTAGVTLVAMSRIQDPNHVSLQVASASPAFPEMNVGVLPNLTDATPITMVSSITQGAIGPLPPFDQLTDSGFGPLDGAQIQTFNPNNPSTPSSSTTFAAIFANGGVPQAAFVNGASFVLVAVGAAPGISAANFWHELTYAMVAADPG